MRVAFVEASRKVQENALAFLRLADDEAALDKLAQRAIERPAAEVEEGDVLGRHQLIELVSASHHKHTITRHYWAVDGKALRS